MPSTTHDTERIYRAVLSYDERMGTTSTDHDAVFFDLLTDLRSLADEYAVDWQTLLVQVSEDEAR